MAMTGFTSWETWYFILISSHLMSTCDIPDPRDDPVSDVSFWRQVPYETALSYSGLVDQSSFRVKYQNPNCLWVDLAGPCFSVLRFILRREVSFSDFKLEGSLSDVGSFSFCKDFSDDECSISFSFLCRLAGLDNANLLTLLCFVSVHFKFFNREITPINSLLWNFFLLKRLLFFS